MKTILTFDLETTGLSFENDRIIQCALLIRTEDGNSIEFNQYFNPGFPISAEATAVHGITDDMVSDMPQFGEYAVKLHELFMDPETIIAGFNIMGFDFKILQSEFTRCGLPFSLVGREVLELGNLTKILFPRTLEAIFKQEVGMTIKDMFGSAHDALNDTKATDHLFELLVIKLKRGVLDLSHVKDEVPQIKEEFDLFDSAQALAKFSRYGNDILDIDGKFKIKDGKTVFGFGKYMGQEVNPDDYNHRGFLQWMVDKDFKPDTIQLVRQYLG